MSAGAVPEVPADLLEMLHETYTDAGVRIWLENWYRRDDEGRRLLELHLNLGANGAIS